MHVRVEPSRTPRAVGVSGEVCVPLSSRNVQSVQVSEWVSECARARLRARRGNYLTDAGKDSTRTAFSHLSNVRL